MKYLKYIGIAVLVLGLMFSMAYYIKTNSRSAITYETEILSYETIEEKIVATGSVIPEDEVNIVPQISGILDEIYVEEGDEVNEGDLLAKIKVVPNEQALNSAEGRVKTLRIILNNSKKEFDRNKKLFDKGVISEQEFNSIELRYNQDAQNLDNAMSDLQIIKLGSIDGSAATNTIVRSTVKGTVLVVPVKEGDQVIEANTFNPGTTISTVADLSKMIFEGMVDEGEVGKLSVGLPLKISLGAIEDKEYDAKLTLISPKGVDVAGAIQFKIEGEVYLDDEFIVRAGYSANASIVTDIKENVLAINEALGYAKAINLDKDKEPEIYNAIKHGTLLENVVYDLETKEVDFDDNSKSENSRICYPINFVENSLGSKGLKSAGPHPNSIIFLACDAYGIMPPLARMTKKQAMYHFISGYTAKMAGTETGITEPVAAFSPCYGGPFLTLHPLRYAELLEQKLNDYDSSVYLVNTGWSGSSATSGSSRIDLKLTKHIINLITDGSLDFSKSVFDKFFNLEIPLNVDGLENEFLVPHHSWDNIEEYFSTGNMLTRLFNNNFEKIKIQDSDILAAGPKTDLNA